MQRPSAVIVMQKRPATLRGWPFLSVRSVNSVVRDHALRLGRLVLERLVDTEAQVIEVRLVHSLTARHRDHDLRVERLQLGPNGSLHIGQLGIELGRAALPAATTAAASTFSRCGRRRRQLVAQVLDVGTLQ